MPHLEMTLEEYRALQRQPKRRARYAATEQQEQAALVERCNAHGYPYNLIYHIPNGGLRHPVVAQQLQAAGQKAGVPDLHLPISRGPWHSLYIELKIPGNTTSPEQEEWIALLRAEGHRVEVCYGQDAAWDAIEDYVREAR